MIGFLLLATSYASRMHATHEPRAMWASCELTRHSQLYGSQHELPRFLHQVIRPLWSSTLVPDNLTPEQRSYTMSRIRSKNTSPELTVRKSLHKLGLRFRVHDSSLCGCPDLVFRKARIAVFIDGDFWHGWRFPVWKHKLAPYWRDKIEGNRRRDLKNFRRLRKAGWRVIRLWEHQIEHAPDECLARVMNAVPHMVNE